MAEFSKVTGTAVDHPDGQFRPWALGDYGRVAMALQPVADRLVARLGDLSGQEILDVATGTGNVALAAVRAGATVVGVDLTPELLAVARDRTDASGLRVDYRLGDAEALPVTDASFDVVASVFGVMFAADHQRGADELVRACRPGGTIALVNWVPDGALATFAGLISAALPSPAGAASPGLWGRESYVRSLLEPRGVRVELFNDQVTWEAESAEAYLATREEIQGSLVAAHRRLGPGPQWDELRRRLLEVLEAGNEATASFRVSSNALVAIGRVRQSGEPA
jgi:SAM-dependent methyltransferase